MAKFWLTPVQLQDAGGFRSHEISRIQQLVEDNLPTLLEAWYDHFPR